MRDEAGMRVQLLSLLALATFQYRVNLDVPLLATPLHRQQGVIVVQYHALYELHSQIRCLDMVDSTHVIQIGLALCRTMLTGESVLILKAVVVSLSFTIRDEVDYECIFYLLPCKIQLAKDEVSRIWTEDLVVQIHTNLAILPLHQVQLCAGLVLVVLSVGLVEQAGKVLMVEIELCP